MTPETRTVLREARVLVRVPLVEPGEDLSDIWNDYDMRECLRRTRVAGENLLELEWIEWDGEPEEEDSNDDQHQDHDAECRRH
jgi:hypothetical protein